MINLLKQKKGGSGNEEIEASNLANINRDFMIDFDDVKLRDIEEGNKRIELILQLRFQANRVKK